MCVPPCENNSSRNLSWLPLIAAAFRSLISINVPIPPIICRHARPDKIRKERQGPGRRRHERRRPEGRPIGQQHAPHPGQQLRPQARDEDLRLRRAVAAVQAQDLVVGGHGRLQDAAAATPLPAAVAREQRLRLAQLEVRRERLPP